MNNPLHERATSGFALSIPTGLAMETLFAPRAPVYDPERVVPDRVQVSNYSRLYINVLTLIRNAYESVDRTVIPRLVPSHMADVIRQEIETIQSLCKEEAGGIIEPVFFFNNYDELFPRSSKIFQRREDKTLLQRQARFIYERAEALLMRDLPYLQRFYLDIHGQSTSALILTHIPADLLSYRRFSKLDMLESYTGRFKTQLQWGSKYYPVPEEDMERLPFCRQLLSVFGDKVLVPPLPIKARREVMEVAKAARWTPMTTPSKVSGDLMRLKDPLLFGAINSIPVH